MSTLLAPELPSAIPDTVRLDSRPARTSLLDRLALHIGLKLLIWGTRPLPLEPDHDRHRRMRDAERARIERELQYAYAAMSLYGR